MGIENDRALSDIAHRVTILIRDEDVHTLKDVMAEQRIRERIMGAIQLAVLIERERCEMTAASFAAGASIALAIRNRGT